ncbi:MAG: hypothetical protein EZS28_030659, partial [Streblomastix strix]
SPQNDSPSGKSPISNRRNRAHSPHFRQRSSSIIEQPFTRPRMGTLQEFIDVLDSLTGIKSDADFNPFEDDEFEEKIPQERKDSFIEQFMDSMKNQEEKQRDLEWAIFVEQANQTRLQEGNDGNNNEKTDFQNPFNIYQSSITENSQSSPTSLLQHRGCSSPKTPKIEKILTPKQLVSELFPIDEVLNNQSGSSRTHNTIIANMKHNKQSQLSILKSQQLMDPMPITPIGDDMKEELKEWNIIEDIDRSGTQDKEECCAIL